MEDVLPREDDDFPRDADARERADEDDPREDGFAAAVRRLDLAADDRADEDRPDNDLLDFFATAPRLELRDAEDRLLPDLLADDLLRDDLLLEDFFALDFFVAIRSSPLNVHDTFTSQNAKDYFGLCACGM